MIFPAPGIHERYGSKDLSDSEQRVYIESLTAVLAQYLPALAEPVCPDDSISIVVPYNKVVIVKVVFVYIRCSVGSFTHGSECYLPQPA